MYENDIANNRAISRIITPMVRGFNAKNIEKAIADILSMRRNIIML